jgi:hypothetical protein
MSWKDEIRKKNAPDFGIFRLEKEVEEYDMNPSRVDYFDKLFKELPYKAGFSKKAEERIKNYFGKEYDLNELKKELIEDLKSLRSHIMEFEDFPTNFGSR